MSAMIPYVVREGDHLLKIAAMRGFDASKVWGDTANEALRTARKDMCVLAPGDVVYIPKDNRTFFPIRVGEANSFTAKPLTMAVHVTFQSDDKPLANAACTVHGLRKPNEFTTDGSGTLSIRVPLTTEVVTVEFTSTRATYELRIGHLDPTTTRAGLYQRLQNLGYIDRHEAMPDELTDGDVVEALLAFQKEHALPKTGEYDDATREKMESVYNG